MKILRQLTETYSLKRRIAELEESIQSKDRIIESLEREKETLLAKVKEMVLKYRGIDSELAGMNYRLYELTSDNKVLSMKITGAKTQSDAMRRWIEKIKEKCGSENI